MISSHTTAPGSGVCMRFAVKPHSHIPAKKPTTIRAIHAEVLRYGSSTAKMNQPASVPHVPGMMGDRPLPKPIDAMCAGWDNINRHVGRLCRFTGSAFCCIPSCFAMGCRSSAPSFTSGLFKVIESSQRKRNRCLCCIHPRNCSRHGGVCVRI